jgi:dTDP-4-dehydrorhamnose reductase
MRFHKVLIAGARGNLSRALAAAAPQGCEVVALPHAALDITDGAAVARALDEIRPDLVFNGAAYNLVDKAESDLEAALRLNARVPAHLARECAARGFVLAHFSTDFVFDGEKRSA